MTNLTSLSIVWDHRSLAKRFPLPSLALAAILLAAVTAGFVLDDYWFDAILIPFLVMSLAGLGLNLTMGYAGQASLGTGAFMAVGAYATYNLLVRLPGLSLPVSLILGGMIAGLVGLVAGLPSLRIKGFYLVATTLAAQFLIEWALNQYPWFSNYASASSISAPRLEILGHDLSGPRGRYALTLFCVVLLAALAWKLASSRTGRNWTAVRDMDVAAAVIGVPVGKAKLEAFFVGAFVCGIAGALWAFAYLGTVDARSFDLDRSFQVMFVIIIGGMGRIGGSFVGAAFIVLLPLALDRIAALTFGGRVDGGQLENLQHILFGGLIVFLLIKEPDGVLAALRRIGGNARVHAPKDGAA